MADDKFGYDESSADAIQIIKAKKTPPSPYDLLRDAPIEIIQEMAEEEEAAGLINDSQLRAPKGSSIGGQWIKAGGGGGAGKAKEYLDSAPITNMFGQPHENGGFMPMPDKVTVVDPDNAKINAMYRQSKDYFKDKGPQDLVEVRPTLENLVATQEILKRSTFEELATNYDPARSTKTIQPGNAYRTPSGKLIIFDGHHRLITAALDGRAIQTLIYEGDLDF